MAFAENRGTYWRGRYKTDPGKYESVKDQTGAVIRFRTKREAERAAEEQEASVRKGTWRDPAVGRETFGAFVSRWYALQDLAASTMQNYRRHIEEHLLPTFENLAVADIKPPDVAAWEKAERALGYAESSLKTWRATLHLILSDAVDEGIRDFNPAAKRRGRGKRAGRGGRRGPEKAVTDALGVLLIAERAALLSGRDDEFVAVVTMGYTGVRFGELVGLEAEYVRARSLRVEWQLYELDTGELHRCPPKDDSRRTIDLPDWHGRLLADHLAAASPKPCECHGRRYAFTGHRAANQAAQAPGAKLVDVARRAGVSTGTVSNVLNRPDTVPEATREKVQAAIADLGYVRGAASGGVAAHWRRSGFATWLFHPAATGRYPTRAGSDLRPVPILGDPWPGIPVRGRNASQKADACWAPVAERLTPHGSRHSHKTLMDGLGTPSQLKDERMGHLDGSVQARYSHVTQAMRERLMEDLTEVWHASLSARRAMSPGSPVAVLDQLLKGGGERPLTG
ncbi:LacI family DNA-binding transcriptional regulator [Catellatospora sp. KI3]|uniref:LacI family DNA-binding transcriptional regulator n=1 Tax=Catellatospora sp. KI3 TaxID=3041620 RepID=UPI002482F50D|nr:LacI family DNA-binding transcriptional regulator [Catellatospora sp. KI3]MDI1465049.1 LacI family DNA-binding transcriptional regulator [Catellatospora sp. KI3]